MITLDPITLSVTLALVFVISVLVLFIFWRINQTQPGVLHWTLGGFLFAMAFWVVFLATLLDAPWNLGPFLSNSMSLPAVLFTIEGCLRFRGYHSSRRWRQMLLAMPVLVLIAWLNKDDPQARLLFHDAASAIGMCMAGVILCWKTSDRYELQANSLAACSAILGGMAFVIRWQYAFLAPEVDTRPMYVPANQVLFFGLIVFTMGWTYGLGVACYFRSNRQVMQLAREDVLTGLPNRRCIDENLGKTLMESRRSKAPFAVMLIDINAFKQVNDKHGHSAGDALLAGIARRLERAIRGSDFAGRLGGDEFVVIARGIESDEMTPDSEPGVRFNEFLQRLRDELNGPMQVRGHAMDIVVSIGVAFWPEDGDSSDAMLSRADTLMYRDKARTTAAEPSFSHAFQAPS
ncbi:GGDEF domain-containing protein [Pseudohongiella acticola]|jgi:diguanylate cyclase (GGDEF)-like protein|uniref:GGDEF domain-containing protein n=1 Tax=Pseudohongiella acticola TaxID=1524254 RepID=UPI0030EDFD86